MRAAKRLLDVTASAFGLILLTPLLSVILFLVWRQDGHSPFYIADRVGIRGRVFRMAKIRSMVVGADRNGVESTSANDQRVTALGHFIRRWKVDELSQLLNVLKGDMSLVGPRPNTVNAVADYGPEELRLLDVKPGITDFSSIVFSDEGEILRHSPNPDSDYDALIRPWKSQLGLLYVERSSVRLDVRLIWLTLVAILDKRKALKAIVAELRRLGAPSDLARVCAREDELRPVENRLAGRA